MDIKKVNELLNAPEGIVPNAVVKAALEKVKKQQEEEQVQQTIVRLDKANRNTVNAITSLRAIRAQEKKARAYLDALSTAENQFVASGDWGKYEKAVVEASQLLHSFR